MCLQPHMGPRLPRDTNPIREHQHTEERVQGDYSHFPEEKLRQKSVKWLFSTKLDITDSSRAWVASIRGMWTYPKNCQKPLTKLRTAFCVPIQSRACYSLNVLENLRTRLETITFTTKNSMTTFWFSVTESWNVLVLNKVLPLHFWVLKSVEFLQANLIFSWF